ncbi:MAG: NAD-dependent dehydratase [Elusimicrobia bacterium]|nr:MAG: NAD-dependent dehydratase [Elusimicrobiota bacterium]
MGKEETGPKRVVVTGGAGFIGSHLVDRLLKDGHSVCALDNFVTGRPENLKHLKEEKRFSLVEADINNAEAVRKCFDGVDWVFHMAALADIVPSIQKPLDYHRSNVDGTVSVLEAARGAGIKRFLYTASSSCYGLAEVTPTPETAPIQPQYPYALTKYLGESYALHWAQVYQLPVTSLRLFNVYGPRSRTTGAYGAVFGVFLAQKLAGKPFTIVGDGEQTRDFTFVTDVADAFVRMAESDAVGEVFNVGSGGTYSVNRLVELLGGDKISLPKRPGEPDSTFADISKIKSRIGWSSSVSFEGGVKIMLDNIDLWRDAPVWNKETISEASKEWFEHLSA